MWGTRTIRIRRARRAATHPHTPPHVRASQARAHAQYDGWDWWVTSPAERASERRGCFGAGSPGAAGADSGMRAAIKGALNRVIAKRYPLGAMEWRDEHLGDNTPYRAQDVGKLLRVLRKRKIDVNGTITGEGFAVEGNVLFVVHSCLHAAKIVTYAGEQVYIDEVRRRRPFCPWRAARLSSVLVRAGVVRRRGRGGTAGTGGGNRHAERRGARARRARGRAV